MPLTIAALLIGATLYFGPGIIAEWPAKSFTLIAFVVLTVGVVCWGGPLLISIVLGAVWDDEHIWLEGGFLHVGRPFTRRVRIVDIRTVETGHAQGEVFEELLTVATAGGQRLSFVADVSGRGAAQLKEQIDLAIRRDFSSPT